MRHEIGWVASQWAVAILGGTVATVLGGVILFHILPPSGPAQPKASVSAPEKPTVTMREVETWGNHVPELLLTDATRPLKTLCTGNSGKCLQDHGDSYSPARGVCPPGLSRQQYGGGGSDGVCRTFGGQNYCPTLCGARPQRWEPPKG